MIKLTFKDLIITSEESLIQGFKEIFKPLYEKHSYILNSNKKILYDECALMEAYLYDKSEINWMDICYSLDYLINILHKIYNRRVVLLIDEYDRNLKTLFAENSPFYSDTVKLLKFLFEPVKNNKKLLFTVFTGTVELQKAIISVGLNHVINDSVYTSCFSEFFGFTETEVDSLLNDLFDLNPKIKKKK